VEFKVPKYLEREATIAFGLTFKKLAVVGSCGLLLFILYYVIKNMFLFLVIAIFLVALIFAFLFLKIKGKGIFNILGEMTSFMIAPRTYFWQKTEGQKRVDFIKMAPKIIKKQEETLKFSPPSRLSKIKMDIDLGK